VSRLGVYILRLPLFRKLSWQLAAAALILLASALAAFGALAWSVAARDLESELGRRLLNAARLSALQLSQRELPRAVPGPEQSRRLTKLLSQLAAEAELERVLLMDLDGRVLGDSLGLAVGSDRYVYLDLDQEEWMAAQLGQARSTTLFTGPEGRSFKSAFAPVIGRDGKPILIVRAEASAGFLEELRSFGLSLAVLGLVALGLGMLLAVLLSRPLVRPLRGMISASRQVAGGDFSARVASVRPDELGQLAGTFNEMAERLGAFVAQRERLAALGEVAAGMAHEIRNPLAAIEGFAGLAEQRVKDRDKEALAHVRDVRREVAVVNEFIGDFLQYARPRPPRVVPCDLAAVVDEAAQVAVSARQRRRWTVKRSGAKLLAAQSDPGQIRQILVNLIKNAREASPKGGGIELGVEKQGRWAFLSVRDHGRGLPEGGHEALFKPFVTSKPMGTGLGLSIAQKLAETLGGHIEAEAAHTGKGSVFTLVLPLQAPVSTAASGGDSEIKE
jgi:signal transduction histidine kinase